MGSSLHRIPPQLTSVVIGCSMVETPGLAELLMDTLDSFLKSVYKLQVRTSHPWSGEIKVPRKSKTRPAYRLTRTSWTSLEMKN